jgi:hypothetical protein
MKMLAFPEIKIRLLGASACRLDHSGYGMFELI